MRTFPEGSDPSSSTRVAAPKLAGVMKKTRAFPSE